MEKQMLNNFEKRIKDLEKLNSSTYRRSIFTKRKEATKLCELMIDNKVENIIEIGTCNGIASALFSSIITGTVHTINTNNHEIKVANTIWKKLDIKNIIQYKGSSLDILPKILNDVNNIGFIYVDGNHSSPYPMKEFEIISSYNINECLVYFDDGPADGVLEAIKKFNLDQLSDCSWMDQENTLRAYKIFGEFKAELN